MIHRRIILLASCLLLSFCVPGVRAQHDQFVAQVNERVGGLLQPGSGDDLQEIEKRFQRLTALSNYVYTHAGPRQMLAMVRAEGALGIFELVIGSRTSDASGVLSRFGAHPGFSTELGLLVDERDNGSGVVLLADRLMKTRSAQVERYPALAAAVCVVHDGQSAGVFSRRINENSPESPDPIEIFDYFVLNAGSLVIAPDRLPAIALVYVVDVTETPDQLRWALNRYRAHPSIGERFFEIEYDYQHFRQNKPKKVSAEPGDYNLEKIKRHGGVCADQAYFAMSVAKACGIPSAYVVARGADVSHAWVGFVETRGRRADWNFDAGRYSDYQNLRGNLQDPQLMTKISDGRVGVLGGAVAADNLDVLASLAGARVVERMRQGRWSVPEDLGLGKRGNIRKPRTTSVSDQLGLLRSVLSRCAGVPRAWDEVVELAKAGEMDEKQMDVWARAVMQLAGRRHEDFAYDFLGNLIVTVDDPRRQHEMWEWAFGQFRGRPDLAAGVRFQQGYLWSMEGNPDFAWRAYQDVVEKFINDGPMVVDALSSMRSMLAEIKRESEIIPILETAAQRVNRPGDMSTQFATQSNYYRIHSMLADAYAEHGRDADAKRIRTRLGDG